MLDIYPGNAFVISHKVKNSTPFPHRIGIFGRRGLVLYLMPITSRIILFLYDHLTDAMNARLTTVRKYARSNNMVCIKVQIQSVYVT